VIVVVVVVVAIIVAVVVVTLVNVHRLSTYARLLRWNLHPNYENAH
jgi:ABC-type uncharacterized transport system permease subunit